MFDSLRRGVAVKLTSISQTLKRAAATVSVAIVAFAAAPVFLEEADVFPESLSTTPKAEAQASTPLYIDTDRDGFSGFTFVGDACGTVGATNVPKRCGNANGWHGDPRRTEGWAQLTNTDRTVGTTANTVFWGGQQIPEATKLGNQHGSILYNQKIPAKDGLEIEFEQVQGGGYLVQGWAGGSGLIDPTRGADGIGFFLVDGDKTTNLTRSGSYGASLGYAQGTSDGRDLAGGQTVTLNSYMVENPSRQSWREEFTGSKYINPGVPNGVIGLGIDTYGNYASAKYGAGYNSSFPGYSLETVASANAGGRRGEVCVRNYHRDQGIRATFNDPWNPQGYGGNKPSICNQANMYSSKQKADSFTYSLYHDPIYEGSNAMNTKSSNTNYLSYWEPRGDVLALRGPGNGVNGYPLLQTAGYGGAQGTQGRDVGNIPTSFGLTSFRANTKDWSLVRALAPVARNLESNGSVNPISAATALLLQSSALNNLNSGWDKPPSNTYYKYFRVQIEPKVPGKSTVEVRVEASPVKGEYKDPNNPKMTVQVPSSAISTTYKLGFSASTGAGTDVHAIRSVRVGSLYEPSLKLEKYHSSHSGYATKSTYREGDTVPYRFKVTNTGNTNIGAIRIDDPALDSAPTCDYLDDTGLAPGASVLCQGTRRLTRDDLTRSKPHARSSSDGGPTPFQSGWTANSSFFNQARARGTSLHDYVSTVYSNVPSVSVPVNTSNGILDVAKFVKGDSTVDINSDGTATAKYYVQVRNIESDPVPIGTLRDFPVAPMAGAATVTGARVRDVTGAANEEAVPFRTANISGSSLLVPASTSDQIPGYGYRLYEVNVDLQFDTDGLDAGSYDTFLTCQQSSGILREGYGGYNRVAGIGWPSNWDFSGPNDNAACINFKRTSPAEMSVSKTAREETKQINDDGTVSVFYDVTVKNTGGQPAQVDYIVDDPRKFGPGSTITGVFTDNGDGGDFVPVSLRDGVFYPSYNRAGRAIEPGGSVTYGVRVDYKFDWNTFNPDTNKDNLTCSGTDSRRGAYNVASEPMSWSDADGPENNAACTSLTTPKRTITLGVPIHLPATGGTLLWISAGSALIGILAAAALAVSESRRKGSAEHDA